MEIKNKDNGNGWCEKRIFIKTVTFDTSSHKPIPDTEDFKEIEVQDTVSFLNLSIEIGTKNSAYKEMAIQTKSPQYIQKFIVTK